MGWQEQILLVKSGHMTKMAAMAIYGKTFESLLLSGTDYGQ